MDGVIRELVLALVPTRADDGGVEGEGFEPHSADHFYMGGALSCSSGLG